MRREEVGNNFAVQGGEKHFCGAKGVRLSLFSFECQEAALGNQHLRIVRCWLTFGPCRQGMAKNFASQLGKRHFRRVKGVRNSFATQRE